MVTVLFGIRLSLGVKAQIKDPTIYATCGARDAVAYVVDNISTNVKRDAQWRTVTAQVNEQLGGRRYYDREEHDYDTGLWGFTISIKNCSRGPLVIETPHIVAGVNSYGSVSVRFEYATVRRLDPVPVQ